MNATRTSAPLAILPLMRDGGAAVGGLIDDWLLWLASANLAEATLRIRRMYARVYCCEVDPLTATPEQVAHFLATRPGRAWSRSGYLSTVRGLHRWMMLTGRRADDPTIL